MRWVFPGAHPFDLEKPDNDAFDPIDFSDIHFDRYRLFATDDLDEVRYRYAQVFNPHRLALQGPHQKVRSRMDHLSLGRMALSRLTWGASVQVDPGSLQNFYLLVLPVRGQAVFHFDGAQIDVSPRAAAVISPERRFHFTASGDYEQIVLKLSQDAVATAWSGLMAGEPAPSICFDVALQLQGQGWSALQPALQWLCRCTRLGLATTAQAALLERTEDLLATTLLLHHGHSQASRFWPVAERAQPLHIRRAQDYMQQHLGECDPREGAPGEIETALRRGRNPSYVSMTQASLVLRHSSCL